MGRPARFDEEQILDAALRAVGEDGPAKATIAAVAKRLGAPVGSIYHRFASRDLLLATLWLRTVRRFQEGFLAALAAGDLEGAAVHTPRWCREHPAEARVLLLHRATDLVARWPDDLGAELTALNSRVAAALRAHAATGEARERLAFALIDVPYGAVRRHLARGEPPPPIVDELVIEACRAVLGRPGR